MDSVHRETVRERDWSLSLARQAEEWEARFFIEARRQRTQLRVLGGTMRVYRHAPHLQKWAKGRDRRVRVTICAAAHAENRRD